MLIKSGIAAHHRTRHGVLSPHSEKRIREASAEVAGKARQRASIGAVINRRAGEAPFDTGSRIKSPSK